MAIAGKVAITPKGEWNSVSTYEKLDAVSHNNGLYIAKKASSGIIPEDGDVWMLATKSIDMDEFRKIIDGTTIVGEAKKAAQDKDGNNIVDTYQTKTGDTENNTVTFNSGDSTNPTGWADIVEVASGETHTSLFRKISLAVKNLRYLYKMLGTTDISAIGDGSVRGAISELNSSFNKCYSVKSDFFTGNIDNLTETGRYWVHSTESSGTQPVSDYYSLECFGYSQRAIAMTTGTIYYRIYVNGAWTDWESLAKNTSLLNIYHYNGVIINGTDGDTIRGIGLCDIKIFENHNVEIDFSVKIVTDSDMTDNFTWGINRDFFTNLCGITITPVEGGLTKYYTDGIYNVNANGYCGKVISGGQFWVPSRVYKEDGTVGIWPSNYFVEGDVLTGTAFGTY